MGALGLECTHCGGGLGPAGARGRRPRPRHFGVALLSQPFDVLAVGAALTLLPSAPKLLLPVALEFQKSLPAPEITLSLLRPDPGPGAQGTKRFADRPAAIEPPRGSVREPPRSAPSQAPARAPVRAPAQAPAAEAAARPAVAAPRLAQPVAVPISEGVVSMAHAGERIVPLHVRAPAGENYLVRLVNVADPHDVTVLYVRGGSLLKVSMPLGTYRVHFAAGGIWYGDKVLFGPQTSYWAVERPVTFARVAKRAKLVSIALRQKTGEMRAVPVDSARF